MINDATTIINLDSEQHKSITIGCAGGFDWEVNLRIFRKQDITDLQPIQITMEGFPGGHSAAVGPEGSENPLAKLAQTINGAMKRFSKLHISEFSGGEKKNSIPTTAQAVVWAPKTDLQAVQEYLTAQLSPDPKDTPTDRISPTVDISVISEDRVPSLLKPMTDSIGKELMESLASIPHGVIDMSPVL